MSQFPSPLVDDNESSATEKAGDDPQAALANSLNMHWVMHWDINETILVGDEVGGDTCEDCFNKIIAKSAFVRMPQDIANDDDSDKSKCCDHDNTSSMVPTHWWDGTPIECSITSKSNDPEIPCPPLFTGWDWPEGCCPYYRTSYKHLAKTFVKQHGSIYRPVYDELKTRMTATNQDTSVFHNILPAFFHTVFNLVHNRKHRDRNGPPVTIVFRTFGSDLPNIARAMTAFAQGKHPDYPDFIHPEYELSTSRLYNAKWVPNGAATSLNPPSSSSSKPTKMERFQYQLFRHDDASMAASGDEQVLNLLHNEISGHFVYGIRDDYLMWKTHNWEPWAGKPVWATQDSSDHHHRHHVLLDDNIHNLPHDGIASVRRRSSSTAVQTAGMPPKVGTSDPSYESLSGPEIQAMQGLHLIRVPTIEPILNLDWFLQQIDKVQTAAIKARHSSPS